MPTALENVLMGFYKPAMISYLEAHPEDFEQAADLALANKQPFSWRAAWLLWSCISENDKRLRHRINDMLRVISSLKGGHQRELLKILLMMDLDDEQEGQLFDVCLGIWEQINQRPSVRFHALKFVVNTAKKYPELKNELSFLTQNHYLEPLSPGIKRASIKMICELGMGNFD